MWHTRMERPEDATATPRSIDRPEFRALVRARRTSSRAALVIGLGFYGAVSLLAGYAPALMSSRVVGAVNLGFLLILATYVLTWVVAVVYVRHANRVHDRLTDAVLVSPADGQSSR